MMAQRSNLTDRAKRYRAQNVVRGERRCVLCGARGRLDVMHLDGNESNGEPQNLAYGCRPCNARLAAAFKRIGAGVPTNQYNPKRGGVPTFAQYAWAVSQQRHSGEHGEAGAVIHATPKSKRIEYAQRIADIKRGKFSERWNPMSKRNIWPFGAGQPLGSRTTHHHRRTPSRGVSAKAAQREARERESERLERKLSASDLAKRLQRHYAKGGTLAEFLQANPGQRERILKLERRNVDPTMAAMLGSEFAKIGAKLKKKATGNPQFFLVANESGQRPPVSRHYDRDGAERKRDKLNADGAKGGPFAVFVGDPDYFARIGYSMKRLNPSGAYRAGQAAMKAAASRYGTVNLTPSIQQREDWRHAWREYMAGWNAEKRVKENPAGAAAEMYEKFHGKPSGEVVEIEKDVFYHGNLAALGELEKLTVRANDGALVDLEGFKGAILCSNERGTQLYIEGGDQAVKLSAFGIGKPYHDIEDLGEVVKLWYFTTKDHLGDQGGEASYHHKLSEEGKVRMQQEFGKRRAPRPRLVYDTQNKALGFAGGEYTVEPEGIRN